MAKRFECPRCGSGVRPNDTQCFRCGELLQDPPTPNPQTAAPVVLGARAAPETPALAKASAKPPGTSKAAPAPAGKPISTVKRLTPDSSASEKERLLEQKEKELQNRERAIEDSLEQLESDTRSLEEALKRFEQEDLNIHERERMLKEREETMEGLAIRMEEALQHSEGEEGLSGHLTEELQRIRQVSEDYSNRIAEERRVQRQHLDREIEERMERLKTLQQLINAASKVSESIPEDKHLEEAIHKEQEASFDPVVVSRALEDLDREMRIQAAKEDKLDVEVIKTQDERLDNILGGGIPVGHVIIINGVPGTMKSTLAYHIMNNAVTKDGMKGMYFSLEQKRDSILRQMEKMGMPYAAVQDGMLVVDMVDLRKAMMGEKGDWRQIMMRYVKNVHSEMPFDIFVLDSLDSFKGLTQFDFNRQHMMDLFDWFKSLNITVLVIAEDHLETLECSKQGETYLADGVIELLMKEFDDAKVYRWLRCMKMRGMPNDPRFYAFYHTGKEFRFSLPLVDSGK